MLKSDLGQICCHSPDADDNRLVLLTRLSLDYSHTYATRTCTARAGCANMRRACSVRGHEQCRAQIHQSLQNWWEMLSQQEIPFWVVRWCGGYEESSFTLLQGGRRGKVAKCCNGSNTVSCWLVKPRVREKRIWRQPSTEVKILHDGSTVLSGYSDTQSW